MVISRAISGITPVSVLWLSFVLLAINLIVYVANTATPHLRADAWFFLSEFLIPWHEGNFSFFDLYTVRSDADHVQPVHRILFFANAELFDLDFRVEAIVGVLFLIFVAGALVKHFKSSIYDFSDNRTVVFMMLCLCMVVLGFNTTNIYTWSLVALGYMTIFINVCLFIYLSKFINEISGKNAILLILMAMLALFVGDDVGILVVSLSALMLFIVSLFKRDKNVLVMAIAIISIVFFYGMIKSNIITYLNVSNESGRFLSAIEYYVNNLGEILEIVSAPFADSVVHLSYLKKTFSDFKSLSIFIGCLVILFHIYCWFFYLKFKLYERSYLPLMLMLYSYALIAGVLVYRIPDFGVGYLHSPRYIRAYQPGLWGALLCFIAVYSQKHTEMNKYLKNTVAGIFVFLFILQFSYINLAWKSSGYINKYSQGEAKRMFYYAGDSEQNSPCKANSPEKICKLKASERERLLGFLKENELNVFSPRIQDAYFR